MLTSIRPNERNAGNIIRVTYKLSAAQIFCKMLGQVCRPEFYINPHSNGLNPSIVDDKKKYSGWRFWEWSRLLYISAETVISIGAEFSLI